MLQRQGCGCLPYTLLAHANLLRPQLASCVGIVVTRVCLMFKSVRACETVEKWTWTGIAVVCQRKDGAGLLQSSGGARGKRGDRKGGSNWEGKEGNGSLTNIICRGKEGREECVTQGSGMRARFGGCAGARELGGLTSRGQCWESLRASGQWHSLRASAGARCSMCAHKSLESGRHAVQDLGGKIGSLAVRVCKDSRKRA